MSLMCVGLIKAENYKDFPVLFVINREFFITLIEWNKVKVLDAQTKISRDKYILGHGILFHLESCWSFL